MVNRPQEWNAYEFVVIAALRAQQLMNGSTPRVVGPLRATMIAQMEVATGQVARAPEGTAPKQCGWQDGV